VQFLTLTLQIFAIYTPISANFDNFSPKNANFDHFFPKKCNFGQFSTSESKKYEEIFHNFLASWGKNRNNGRIFTYAQNTSSYVSIQ